MAAGSNLYNLFADLAKQPSLLSSFEEDPTSVMQSYGLSDEQIDLINFALDERNPDPQRYRSLGEAFGDEAEEVLFIPIC
jgi:hypothetical protein